MIAQTATAKTTVAAPFLKTDNFKNCWTHDHGLKKEQKVHAHHVHIHLHAAKPAVAAKPKLSFSS